MYMPGDGNLFVAKPEPLVDLLTDINKHKTALPNFQRPWVWGPEQVRDLIISVAYRYPAGSLLTMPVTTSAFALRPFEGSGDVMATTPTLMVLDGQQRLTSLYQALYRSTGVQVAGRTYHFYLDVQLLMDDAGDDTQEPIFEQALFYTAEGKNGKRVRYDGLQAVYELTTRDQELTAGALPLRVIFDADGALAEWGKDYLVRRSNSQMDQYLALDKRWVSQVRPWLDRIRHYPFPVIELRADMPLRAICHIFEKVNSTGVPLDVFDLCTAILWAQGYHLNEEWSRAERALRQANILPMQPLNGTAFLQGIALLNSLERKRQNPNARLSVSCRKEDLMTLKAGTVREWWDVLLAGYREASKFMTDQGILSERILPYTTLILPLSTMLADLRRRKGEAYLGAAWSKIEQWYWCSIFSQRYSSRVETNSAQDYEQVMSWIDGGDPPEVVRTFTFRSEALQEISSIRNAIYKGVLCLLARAGAKDFGGGGKLSTALFYDTRQDHHHIFPTDAFVKLGIKDPRANTIVNKTLIGSSVNRSIGGKLPSQYVHLYRHKLGAQFFDDILSSHAIDPALLAGDQWEGFVADRREKLRQLILSVCRGNVQPFVGLDAEALSSDVDEDEASAA